MTIVAFLQNMWVNNPRTAESISKHNPTSDMRERMIAYALFRGCITGRRLASAFGTELCYGIVWQEANPTISTNPKDYYPPNAEHIRSVLDKHKPDIVLCLTKTGEKAIRSLLDSTVEFISCIHPACRNGDVMNELVKVRNTLIELIGHDYSRTTP